MARLELLVPGLAIIPLLLDLLGLAGPVPPGHPSHTPVRMARNQWKREGLPG